MKSSYDASADPPFEMLAWDRVQKIMFKMLNKLTPPYMDDMFSARDFSYSIRTSENILQIPKPRTNFLKRSFGYSGAVLWNGLPSELRP